MGKQSSHYHCFAVTTKKNWICWSEASPFVWHPPRCWADACPTERLQLNLKNLQQDVNLQLHNIRSFLPMSAIWFFGKSKSRDARELRQFMSPSALRYRGFGDTDLRKFEKMSWADWKLTWIQEHSFWLLWSPAALVCQETPFALGVFRVRTSTRWPFFGLVSTCYRWNSCGSCLQRSSQNLEAQTSRLIGLTLQRIKKKEK